MRGWISFRAAGKALSGIVAALALLSFPVAFFMPVYTDEIGWKYMQGRLGYDGLQSRSLAQGPSCGAAPHDIPALLLPFRWLDTWLYQDLPGPLAIRLLGCALGLAWMVLAFLLIRGVTRRQLGTGTVGAGLLAFSTLGIMPFLLVMSRPEQILVLCLTVLLVPLIEPSLPAPGSSWHGGLARAAGLTAASIWALCAHQRAILAVPLMLVAVYRAAGRRSIAAGCGAVILVYALVNYRIWAAHWACPGDPEISSILLQASLGSALDQGQLGAYLASLLRGLGDPSSWYLTQFTPKAAYTSGMLPAFAPSFAVWLGPLITLYFGALIAAGLGAFALTARRSWRDRSMRVTLLALASVWLFYAAATLLHLTKNDYEATLMEPVLALAALGSLWAARPALAQAFGDRGLAHAARGGFLGLLALSAVSQVGLLASYLPHVFGSWSVPGYARGQPFSVTEFGYDALRDRILATAGICGIDPASRPRHLVLDELTYFALRSSYQPFLMTYLDANHWGRSHPDPTPMLVERGSAGMVVGCQSVPTSLRSRAQRHGQFCCVPAFSPASLTPAAPDRSYRLGDRIDLGAAVFWSDYLVNGWSHAEEWGTWTEGGEAELILQVANPTGADIRLRVLAIGYQPGPHRPQTVTVQANGQALATWSLRAGPPAEKSAIIPAAILGTGPLRISFTVAEPTSPHSQGISLDPRRLGMGVLWMVLEPSGG